MKSKSKNSTQGKRKNANSDSQSATPLEMRLTDKNILNRNSRPRIVIEKVGETFRPSLLPESLPGLERTFATNDRNAIIALVEQLLATLPRANQNPARWNFLLATLHDIGPKDTLEGLLAVQMVSVHVLAMEFLARAMDLGQSFEGTDANINRANKLLRTFGAQVESLNHHRGKAPHPMMVGSVNVANGGQAIVGPVNCPGPGKVSKADDEKKRIG